MQRPQEWTEPSAYQLRRPLRRAAPGRQAAGISKVEAEFTSLSWS